MSLWRDCGPLKSGLTVPCQSHKRCSYCNTVPCQVHPWLCGGTVRVAEMGLWNDFGGVHLMKSFEGIAVDCSCVLFGNSVSSHSVLARPFTLKPLRLLTLDKTNFDQGCSKQRCAVLRPIWSAAAASRTL